MERIAAGKITRAFGKEGEVNAVLYDLFPAEFDTREPLHVYIDGLAVPLFIARFERRGKRGALFVFDDIDTEDHAAIITGLEFFINRNLAEDTASDDGLDEFTGYTAILAEEGTDGETTGIILSIEGNDSNPLFNIEAGGKEILVPASEDLISGLDIGKRILYLTLPEGLLDL